jgi:hypothetical protein
MVSGTSAKSSREDDGHLGLAERRFSEAAEKSASAGALGF